MPPSTVSVSLAQLYWSVSAVICVINSSALGYLFYRLYAKRKRLGAVKCFATFLLGDLVFFLGFTPYHIRNAITKLVDPDYVLADDDEILCKPVGYLTVISFVLMFCGVSLASYQPYHMVKYAQQMKKGGLLSTQTVCIHAVVSLVFGVGVAILADLRGKLGSYRGLYCAFSTMEGWETGGVLFGLSVGHGTACAIFMFLAYRKSKKIAQAGSNKTVAAANVLRLLSLKVAVFFLILLGPTGISALVGMVGSEVPPEFDLFSGWIAKMKPLADVWVILSLKLFKKTQNQNNGLSHSATLPQIIQKVSDKLKRRERGSRRLSAQYLFGTKLHKQHDDETHTTAESQRGDLSIDDGQPVFMELGYVDESQVVM